MMCLSSYNSCLSSLCRQFGVSRCILNPEYFIEKNYTKKQKAQYDAYLKMAKIIKDKNYVKEYKNLCDAYIKIILIEIHQKLKELTRMEYKMDEIVNKVDKKFQYFDELEKPISIHNYISDEEFEYLHNLGPSIKAIKWVKDTYDDDLGVDELDA